MPRDVRRARKRDGRENATGAKARQVTKLHFKASPTGGAFCLGGVDAVGTHLCRIICTLLEGRPQQSQIICIYRGKNITYRPKKSYVSKSGVRLFPYYLLAYIMPPLYKR